MSNFKLSAGEIRKLKAAGVPVPTSLKELDRMIKEAEEEGGEIPLADAIKEIHRRINRTVRKNVRATDEEVKRMRAAGIPVPESLEEVRVLLQEAEEDTEGMPKDEAFREIRAKLRKRWEASRNA